FHLYPSVGKPVPATGDRTVGQRGGFGPARYGLGPRAQQFGRQDVQLRCFVDRFGRIPPEQLISPRDQIVQILEDDREFVRSRSQSRDGVWSKSIHRPHIDLSIDVLFIGVGRWNGRVAQDLEKLVDWLCDAMLPEWEIAPVTLYPGGGVARS